jgi:CheY-like chemotaxis protein
VLTARDGREALGVLEGRADVDLLFTDVVMPGGISGLDLAGLARSLRPSLRILTTSGHMGRAEAEPEAETSFRTLPKPYRRRDLARAIREALDGPAPAVPARPAQKPRAVAS